MTEDRKRLMSAWRTLNKAHTVLMADPSSQPLAREVLATMLKLEDLAERRQRAFEKQQIRLTKRYGR